MFFRRLMRTSAALRRASKDGGVLAAIRAELAHELGSSSPSPPPSFGSEYAPEFATVSDAPQAQDLLLRRRTDSEEVLVSALLAPLYFFDQEQLPRFALMKVFVTKTGGAAPVLHFNCRTSTLKDGGANYSIDYVRYHSSPGCAGEDKYYEWPKSRQLDHELQLRCALKDYLVARGVTDNLAASILQHLLQKERVQYVNWLNILEERFSKDI